MRRLVAVTPMCVGPDDGALVGVARWQPALVVVGISVGAVRRTERSAGKVPS